jgi:hypothetical protein
MISLPGFKCPYGFTVDESDVFRLGTREKESSMLWTIGVILLILWLLGFIGHVGGGLIHILLVIAVVVILIQVIQGRR